MWGFATQAGAGMAIAGLTATYYALANRNYQGERERMAHESGHGDGPQVRSLVTDGDAKNPQLSSSNMLLKKELQELSFLNGSVSGLNVLYQQQIPLNKFPRSDFEMTPINSRASLDPSREDVRSIIAAEPDPDVILQVNNDRQTMANELFEMEENAEESGDATPPPSPSPANKKPNKVFIVQPKGSRRRQTVGEKWKAVQSTESLNRKASAICFFRNPGFGHRHAVQIKQETESPPAPIPIYKLASQLQLSQLEKLDEDTRQEVEVAEAISVISNYDDDDDKDKDSTQFILSPTLSKSTVSFYEKDIPEKLLQLQRGEKRKSEESIAAPSAKQSVVLLVKSKKSHRKNYNEKLKKRRLMTTLKNRKSQNRSHARIVMRADPDPEIGNVRGGATRKKSAKPIPVLPHKVESSPAIEKLEKEIEDKLREDEFVKTELDENDNEFREKVQYSRPEDYDSDVPSEGVVEEPLLVPSKLKLVGTRSQERLASREEDTSWRTLPVRVFTASMVTMPWPLLGVCALVVIVAGFFGMFLVSLANDVAGSIEDNLN